MRSTFKIIKTEEELDQLIQYCQEEGVASIDFETNAASISSLEFYPTIVGVSFQAGSGWIFPLGHKDSPFKHNWERLFVKFSKAVVENPSIVKYFFNALFEYRIFLRFNIRPRGRVFDVMLMKYLLHEERPNDLKSLVARLLPDFEGYDLQGQPGKKAKQSAKIQFWSNVELEELSEYCALDCDCTLRIGIHMENRLMEMGLYRLFRNMYMPLVRALSITILEGVMVDRDYLDRQLIIYRDDITSKLKAIMSLDIIEDFNDEFIQDKLDSFVEILEDEIDEGDLSDRMVASREEKISRVEAGDPSTKKEVELFDSINFNSSKQLAKLLYSHPAGFEFPVIEYTEAGAESTAEGTLLKLMTEYDEPFITMLLEYRGLQKMYTTYIKGILEDQLTHNDRIHPSYLLHGTVTGRLSSRGPNFQNIPRSTTAAPIKRMFIAPKDHWFVEMDLSQAELRYAAEVSGDPTMLKIFEDGKNIHVATAAHMFGIDYGLLNKARKDDTHPDHLEMVKKHKSAKVLNFTIFYGAGPQKVAEFLTERTGDRHTKHDAIDFIENWFEAYPVCKKWIAKQHKAAIREGEVKSMFGRKRRLPIFLNHSNKRMNAGAWNQGLRQAVNAEIQGGSSDITQWMNLVVYEYILKGILPSYMRLVSTVHDSIEYYVRKEDAPWVFPIMLTIAKTLPGMEEKLGKALKKVPMKASIEYGVNWGEMHRYNPKKGDSFDSVKQYNSEYEKHYNLRVIS